MRMLLIAAMAGTALAGGAASAQPAATVAERTTGLAITGVTVLPMTRKDRLLNQTVLVRGDRIEAVGPASRVRLPAGYEVVSGRGKTLMPGLVDMHIHLSPEPGRPGDSTERALALELAHGVTTARVMLGQPVHPAVRVEIEQGTIAGPRIYIAAKALNDQNIPDEGAARAAVAKAKSDGFDLIKTHAISKVPVWEALQAEARAKGIPTAGHVTNAVGLGRALAAGQQVEHLDSVPAELLPEGASRDFGQFLDGPVLADIGKVASARYDEVARRAAASKAFFVPTLAAFERIGEMDRPFAAMVAEEPDSTLVAPWIIDQWKTRRDNLCGQGFTPLDARGMRDVRRRIVRAFHRAGVPMMAGSDTPHPFHVWGFGLIREIEVLAEAGMRPMGALRAATVVPRDYLRSLPGQGSALGWKADFGTVEPGARADLLLLDADPARSLSALRSIRMVVAGGRIYRQDRLKAMLASARRSGQAQPRPAG